MKTQPNVLVTGASSGIGWAVTEALTARGIRVFGSVRTRHDAERLLNAFKEQVVPLIFDTTDVDAVAAATKQVRDTLDNEPLFGIVNNAGTGTAAPLLYVPIAEFRQQFEVNVIGTLNVIQHFVPLLRSKGRTPGRVINIGSTAGRIGIPFFGAYAASKHALSGLSESLRRELLPYGVDVITVVPGPVKTAILFSSRPVATISSHSHRSELSMTGRSKARALLSNRLPNSRMIAALCWRQMRYCEKTS